MISKREIHDESSASLSHHVMHQLPMLINKDLTKCFMILTCALFTLKKQKKKTMTNENTYIWKFQRLYGISCSGISQHSLINIKMPI